MTHQEATFIVKMLEGNVPFFPRDEAAQALIADELVSMGATVQQGMWLARRYAQLYTKEWKFPELRALYCSKFRPADGVETYSTIYLDGIPSEKKQQSWTPQIEGGGTIPAARQLAAAPEQISKDPEMSALVQEIAQRAKVRPIFRPRTIEQIEAELYKKRPVR